MPDAITHARPARNPKGSCAVCADPVEPGEAWAPTVDGDGVTCRPSCHVRHVLERAGDPSKRVAAFRDGVADFAELDGPPVRLTIAPDLADPFTVEGFVIDVRADGVGGTVEDREGESGTFFWDDVRDVVLAA